LRDVDCGLIRENGGAERIGCGDQLIALLSRNDSALGQHHRTIGIGLRADQLRAVARLLGLCLLERSLEGPRIDLEQQIAFFDKLPFLEIGGVDDAVDALMQLAQDDIEHERVPELKKALLDLKHDRKLRYGVTYKLIGNEEHEHPDRFEHMDEAVKVACELLDQRKARVVDIPDPAGKGGGGGMRHSDIVQRGTQLGFKKK